MNIQGAHVTFGHLVIQYIACEATGGSSSDGHHIDLVKDWEYRENKYNLKGENS